MRREVLTRLVAASVLFHIFFNNDVSATIPCAPINNVTILDADFRLVNVSSSTILTTWNILEGDFETLAFIYYEFDYDQQFSHVNCLQTHKNVNKEVKTCEVRDLVKQCSSYDLCLFTQANNNHSYSGVIENVQTTPDESPPRNFACESTGGILHISWESPSEECEKRIYQYVISYNGTSTCNDALLDNNQTETSKTSLDVDAKLHGAEYKFSIFATYDNDTIFSRETSVVCFTEYEPLGPPQDISVDSIEPHSATLSWGPPIDPICPPTNYLVMAVPVEGFGVYKEYNCSESPCNVSELESCTTYNFSVSAFLDNVEGIPSEAESDNTGPDDDTNIAVICNTTDDSVYVEWLAVLTDCKNSTYNVNYTFIIQWPEPGEEKANHSFVGADLIFTVPQEDYYYYTQYTFEVYTQTNFGTCSIITNDGKSSPPTIVSLDSTLDSIFISWIEPESPQGLVQGYTVSWVDDVAGSQEDITLPNTATSHLIPDLLSCSSYTVSVMAVNSAGNGEPAVTNATTEQQGPTNAECQDSTSTSIGISWTNSPSRCNEEGTLLIWTRTSNCDDIQDVPEDDYIKVDNVTGTETVTWEVTDLLPCSDYIICVDSSDETIESNVTCCGTSTLEDVPNPPRDLKTDATKSSLTLTWSAPQYWNGLNRYYKVICSPGSFTQTLNDTNTQVTGLKPSTKYTCEVMACTDPGCSDEISKTTPTLSEGPNVGLIVGLTLTVTLLLAAAGTASVYFYRRRKNRKHSQSSHTESINSLPMNMWDQNSNGSLSLSGSSIFEMSEKL